MDAFGLIDALGGTAVVAKTLDLQQSTISNWRQRGFPSWALGRLARLCEERGIDPGDALEAQPPRRGTAA
jgi:hypothetical protein